MISIPDTPPPGTVDRRDGSTKGECGITTTGCLFCKDQIAGSSTYVQNYDQMKWGPRDGCQFATCPFWGQSDCWYQMVDRKRVPKTECPIYKRKQLTGVWEDVEREEL